jgi:polysaccharide export outer membrane protein
MKGRTLGARVRKAGFAGIAALLVFATGGCAYLPSFMGGGSRPVSPPPGEPLALDRDAYVIGPEDRLQVVVWRNPELSVIVPVRPDGRISVPLVDDVQAAGLTTAELKLVLAEKLAEYVKNPEVTVIVEQINSKRVYLMGGLARQSAIPLTQDMRVLDAIAVAGGFTTFARKGDVKILRREASGLQEYRFDYDAFLDGRASLESNFLLQPGDTIVVPD